MIVVFGSINLDFLYRVDRLPGPGETVLAASAATAAGGKGANQALAARRAGADVLLAGSVGRDANADPALALLDAGGVDLARVARLEAPTGTGFVTVDAAGRNQIVVASGANAVASADLLADYAWSRRDILLLQCEMQPAETLSAARQARAGGARIVLNAAPARPIDAGLLGLLDVLVVNEHEAATLAAALQWPSTDASAFVAHAAQSLGLACIATLGEAGAVAAFEDRRIALPALPVRVVDTVGAGDAFVGALAAGLAAGDSLEAAMRMGVVAGSLACTRAGAQPSLPLRTEIDAAAADLPAGPVPP
jgi:ribokinase